MNKLIVEFRLVTLHRCCNFGTKSILLKNFLSDFDLNLIKLSWAVYLWYQKGMFLILGSSGYIGSKIFHLLKENERKVVGISRSEIDYTNPKILKEFLRSKKPRFLINAAGYTGKPNVDACELAKADCLDGNSVLPGTIRQVCEELNITWGHVSSGCIYSGRRSDG